jgi:hypothetical protein
MAAAIGIVAASGVCWPVVEAISASPNSFAEPQRPAGSFCSAVRIAVSAGGTLGHLAQSEGLRLGQDVGDDGLRTGP